MMTRDNNIDLLVSRSDVTGVDWAFFQFLLDIRKYKYHKEVSRAESGSLVRSRNWKVSSMLPKEVCIKGPTMCSLKL